MALVSTTKQNYEKYFIHGDFSAVLDEGETIASESISAIDAAGDDATSAMIDMTSPFVDGAKQYVRIQGGTQDGSPYKVTIRVVTSAGNQWEVDCLVKVKEL